MIAVLRCTLYSPFTKTSVQRTSSNITDVTLATKDHFVLFTLKSLSKSNLSFGSLVYLGNDLLVSSARVLAPKHVLELT